MNARERLIRFAEQNRNAPVSRQNGQSSRNFISALTFDLPMTSRLRFQNESGEGSAVRDVTFMEWLSGLKTSGSNLLVTGEVPETPAPSLAGRSSDRGQTRSLGLLNPATPAAESYLPVSPDSPGMQVIDRRPDDRGTTTTGSEARHPMVDRQTFRSEVVSAIGVHEERNGGFEPAELRLGLDSVELLEVNDDLVSVGQFGGSPPSSAFMHVHHHLRVRMMTVGGGTIAAVRRSYRTSETTGMGRTTVARAGTR